MKRHDCSSVFAAGKIDREAGVIFGVSLATVGPAKGHGMVCDAVTLEPGDNNSYGIVQFPLMMIGGFVGWSEANRIYGETKKLS